MNSMPDDIQVIFFLLSLRNITCRDDTKFFEISESEVKKSFLDPRDQLGACSELAKNFVSRLKS